MKLETEVRSKNTPAITDYHHRCRERQQNENPRDYDFNISFYAGYTMLYAPGSTPT